MNRRLTGPAAAAVAAALTFAVGLVGCSGEPEDPAEQHRASVEARLRTTFAPAQVRCILRELDDDTMAKLDRTRDLPAGSEAQSDYTNALTTCVTD